MASHRTPRVVAARKLTTRSGRRHSGRFLAEGAQVVDEALRHGTVREVFVTDAAASRNDALVQRARSAEVEITRINGRAAELLSETVTPQGLVAVCERVDVAMTAALTGRPRTVVVLVGVSDPGNAGTVLRVADAAGADAVIFADESVDPHNGKCVRASTGSLFHLPVTLAADLAEVLAACEAAGLVLTATDGAAGRDITEMRDLGRPRAWLFGSEAHGLDDRLHSRAVQRVRVPIYGRAESLNLATAAAVCLYAAAMSGGSDRAP